jgi:curved DNA-binding protein CbpA
MNMQRGVPDPYRQLGIQRAATEAQIKSAHRKLAKRYHPDAPEADTIRFLAIQEAYLLLSDPLRRREWDSRHAPGPVRAGEAARRTPQRPRAGDGRWTREEGASGATSRQRSGQAAKRPTASRPERPAAGSDAGEGQAEDRGTGAEWSASGRDPSTRTYRWSAENVPWWEDFSPHGAAPAGAEQHGKPSRAGATGAGPKASGARGSGAKAAGGSTAAGGPGQSKQPGQGAPAGQSPSASAPAPGSPDAGPSLGDIYSRSSGAAWSSAARQYFRKATSDLPNRGNFVYRGTQVVTGAKAREASDDLLRQRPGVNAAPRQAFEARPSDGPRGAATNPHGSSASAASGSSASRASDRRAGPRSPTGAAPVPPFGGDDPHWARDVDPDGHRTSRGPSLAGPAAAGGVASLAVTVPLLVLGSFVLNPPLQPAFAAILLIVAALTGALAAAIWVRVREI